MNNAPDLEIYVADINVEQCLEWLSQSFTDVTKQKKVKGMPKQAFPFTLQYDQQSIEGVIYDQVVKGFTSIWLNSRALPWEDDTAWGIMAAETLKREVRVAQNSWAQDQNPDAWLSIKPDATTIPIIWKT